MSGNGVVVLILGLVIGLMGAGLLVQARRLRPIKLPNRPTPIEPKSGRWWVWIGVNVLWVVAGLFLIGISFTQ
jgi:hypothetical protein